MLSELIHSLGVIIFGSAIYWEFYVLHVPPEFPHMIGFPGRWKYLTIWNMFLQLFYHLYSLANDFYGSNELNRRRQTSLQKIRDGFFASWIYPTGMFVSLTFWGLYAIDRELVFPLVMDTFYPKLLNHAVHTGPITLLTLEILTIPRILPQRWAGLVGTGAFTLTYIAWITWVFTRSGEWAYPVLQVMNNVQRTLFLSVVTLSNLGLYFLGEKIQKIRWAGSQTIDVDGKNKSGKKMR